MMNKIKKIAVWLLILKQNKNNENDNPKTSLYIGKS